MVDWNFYLCCIWVDVLAVCLPAMPIMEIVHRKSGRHSFLLPTLMKIKAAWQLHGHTVEEKKINEKSTTF